MDVLPLHVFKDSFGPIVNLLNENGITFKEQETRSAEIMASSFTLDVVIDGDTWRSLATVIVSFIQGEAGREVFITTEDNRVIQSSGLGAQTLQDILERAARLLAADS